MLETESPKSLPALISNQSNWQEKACSFGTHAGASLFGVLSFLKQPANENPVILLLNSGSVHHIGPGRLYVTLSRTLASLGYTTFRMDFQGLGDSVGSATVRENHPYPDSAVADTDSAINYLKENHGCRRFILLGLCSGAHTAFHGGVDLTEQNIVDSILINPLTYEWVEGMSLATNHFQEVAYYKQTMKSTEKWGKLLKGQIDYQRAAAVALKQLKNSTKKILAVGKKSKLSADLGKLFLQKRPLTLFIAENDPGLEILMDGAKTAAKTAIKAGKIRVLRIKDADHTFTTLDPRNDLIRQVCDHLNRTT